jgi:AI-2 transport protein TqsA
VWAWVLGPIGAVLAVPLTLLVRAFLLEGDQRTRWFAGLLGPLDVKGPSSSPRTSASTRAFTEETTR